MAIEESLILDLSSAIDAVRNELGAAIDELPGQLQIGFDSLDVSGAVEALRSEFGAELEELAARLQAGFDDIDMSGAASAIRDEIGAEIEELPGQLQIGFDNLDASGAGAAVREDIGAEIHALQALLQERINEIDGAQAAQAIHDDFTPVINDLSARLREAFEGLEDSGAFEGLNDAVEQLANTMAQLGGATENVFGGPGKEGLISGTDPGGVISTAAVSSAGLRKSVEQLGGTPVIAVVSLGAAFTAMAADALDAESATNSFNLRVGELAPALNRVDVAGFNEDLSTFAIRIGADDDAMRLALARIVDLSIGSNKTREEVGKLGQEFTALAGYLSLVNPSLGTADQVLQSLPNVLARGGRSLANYGIALSTADINQRAVADSGGKAVEELTIFDKAAAGLALTMDQLGPKFDENFNKALEDPKNQLRALRTAVSEAGEAAAAPVIEPLVDSLTALTPVLIETAQAIGAVGSAFATVLGPTVAVVAPLLSDVADVVDALPDPLVGVGGALLLLNTRFHLLSLSTKAATFDLSTFATTANAAAASSTRLSTANAAAAASMKVTTGSILGGVGLVFGLKTLADYLDRTVLGIRSLDEETAEAFGKATAKEQVDELTKGIIDMQDVIDHSETNQPGFLKQFKELATSNTLAAAQLRNELLAQGYEVSRLDRIMFKQNETGREAARVAGGTAAIIAGQYNPAALRAAAIVKDWTGLEDELADAIDEVAKSLAENDERIEAAGLKWRVYAENLTDAEGASSRFAEEMADLSVTQGRVSDSFITFARSVKDNGASLDLNTQAGRRNDETLRDLIATGAKYVGQIYEGEGASKNYADAQAGIRDQLVNVMNSLGINQVEQAKYIALWDLVPREVETNVVIKISTIFVGASKGEEQRYFDQLAEATGESTEESRQRLRENLYDLTPPEDTKAKTAKELKDFINGLSNDIATGLADGARKAGGGGGAALTDAMADEIEFGAGKVYTEVEELNADLAAYMAAGGEDMMSAYGEAVASRVESILDPLREVGEEIISQIRFDMDTIDGLFNTWANEGGSQLGPKSADLAAQAKGFAAGATADQARQRLDAAVGAGLITKDNAEIIWELILAAFLKQVNDLAKTRNDQAMAFVNQAGLSPYLATTQIGGQPWVFTRRAHGGITEPGIYNRTMFAEPETGGEAYIPLASDRRDRATAVLGDVANRFGYSLISRSGAVSVPSSSPIGGGSLERIAALLESLPDRLPRPLTVTAPIDNVSYGDTHDVSEQVVRNVTRTLAGIGASVSLRQGRR